MPTTHTDPPQLTVRQTPSGVRIECDVHIAAPREFIWEVIQEPTRRLEWDSRLSAGELLTPRPIGKGTLLRTFYGLLGWIDLDYVSWQPPARSAVASRATSRGNVVHSVIGSWNFRPHDDNSTTWRTQLLVRARGGRMLAPLLERLLIGPMLGRFTVISARKLKQLVEREYPAIDVVRRAA